MKQDKKEKRNNILYSVLGLVLGIKEVGAYCGYFIDTKGSGIKVYYK